MNRQHKMIAVHQRLCVQHPAIVAGAWPDWMGVRACIRESLSRGHVKLAIATLRTIYNDAERHEIIAEYPTIAITGRYGQKHSRSFRADLAVIDPMNDTLVAVVEVGDLSSIDKCEVWEQHLPGVRVIWIPKSDLETSRFKLTLKGASYEASGVSRDVRGGDCATATDDFGSRAVLDREH